MKTKTLTNVKMMSNLSNKLIAKKFGLKASSLNLLIHLCFKYNLKNNEVFIPISELASLINLSEKTVSRHLSELKSKQLITIYKNGKNNVYQFTDKLFEAVQ